MRRFLLMIGLAGSAAASAASEVTLCDERHLANWQGAPVGNVSRGGNVLTKGAVAQQPKGNCSGWIGWIDCSEENHPLTLRLVGGVPVGSRLILRNPAGKLLTLFAGKAVIEEWGFDPDGSHVVLKSRSLHGPALIERFKMKDGFRSDACPAWSTGLPSWAAPYAD